MTESMIDNLWTESDSEQQQRIDKVFDEADQKMEELLKAFMNLQQVSDKRLPDVLECLKADPAESAKYSQFLQKRWQ